MPQEIVNTSYGEIFAVVQGKIDSDKTLLLLHGNSSTWKAFKPVLDSEPLNSTFRIIAFDLPGHGDSKDAADPERSYNIPAYAHAAVEVLRHFGVKSFVAYGSSMGGQIAWDMINILRPSQDIFVRGVMTSGSSPIGNVEELMEGFKVQPEDNAVTAAVISDEQVQQLITLAYGGTPEPFMSESLKRTDTRARPLMFANIANGQMTNQRKVVKETKVPIALVNGENDAFIKLDVLDELEFGNLWKGKAITIMGSGHCPYWDNPAEFLPILNEFATGCYA